MRTTRSRARPRCSRQYRYSAAGRCLAGRCESAAVERAVALAWESVALPLSC